MVHGPQDLSGLPLAPVEEVLKVVGGLVQVEDQGEGHVGRWGLRGGYRSQVTMSMVRRASSAP